jgi:haloalkane dehalogenase
MASLTVMNGFYSPSIAVRPPAMIALFSLGQLPAGFPTGALPPQYAANLDPLAGELMRTPALVRRLFTWQVRQFFGRRADADRFVPGFLGQFLGPRSSLRPLRSLTADLIPAVAADAARVPELAQAPFPIRLIWGGADPDLAVGVAQDLHRAVPASTLHVLPRARHYLQIDEPGRVARLLADGS